MKRTALVLAALLVTATALLCRAAEREQMSRRCQKLKPARLTSVERTHRRQKAGRHSF